jgi:hypothetical protein
MADMICLRRPIQATAIPSFPASGAIEDERMHARPGPKAQGGVVQHRCEALELSCEEWILLPSGDRVPVDAQMLGSAHRSVPARQQAEGDELSR